MNETQTKLAILAGEVFQLSAVGFKSLEYFYFTPADIVSNNSQQIGTITKFIFDEGANFICVEISECNVSKIDDNSIKAIVSVLGQVVPVSVSLSEIIRTGKTRSDFPQYVTWN